MKLHFRFLRHVAILLAMQSSMYGCSAHEQPSVAQKVLPPPTALTSSGSKMEREAILLPVKKAYALPAQSYLCSTEQKPTNDELRKRFADIFSEQILEGFFLKRRRCDIVASARFGFTTLDTSQAIKQAYVLNFSEPFLVKDSWIVEVRFRPILGKKQGEEGGAIVHLEKISGGWRIANIESVEQLGANGFQSLIQDHPSVSNDNWSDMNYSKSLSFPTPNK